METLISKTWNEPVYHTLWLQNHMLTYRAHFTHVRLLSTVFAALVRVVQLPISVLLVPALDLTHSPEARRLVEAYRLGRRTGRYQARLEAVR